MATIQDFPTIQAFLDGLKAQWTAANPKVSSWFSVPYGYLHTAAQFILANIDDAICQVEAFEAPGVDKKAIVMDLAGQLFDFIAAQAFPIYLKPLVPFFKRILINVLVSNLIDFMVTKYNSGAWAK